MAEHLLPKQRVESSSLFTRSIQIVICTVGAWVARRFALGVFAVKESLLAPAEPGSYILLLFSPKRSALTVGRLGDLTVEPGWYLYVGSALGAGGLRVRLRHHLRPLRRPHWHIDYLRQACDLRAIWFVASAERWEHRWAQTLSAMETAMPLPGFGASDCRCVSHCFF